MATAEPLRRPRRRHCPGQEAGLGADGHDVFDEKNFDESVSHHSERAFHAKGGTAQKCWER